MTEIELASRMGKEPIAHLLVRFSVPAVAGLAANALYNIVDRIFIGHIVGGTALAAVSVTFPLSAFVIAVGSMIGIGGASQLSRALGDGRHDKAELVIGNTASASILAGLLMASGVLWRIDELTELMGASAALAPITTQYVEIISLGLPFQIFAFTACSILRAEGSPERAMAAFILGAFANIALDWLFIAVMGLGVTGAAYGTVLAQIMTAIYTASAYTSNGCALKLRARAMILSAPVVREMMLIGMSPFMLETFFALSMVMFNNALVRTGGDMAISAMGIFFSLDNILYLPVFGIGEGLQPIVGYNYGANNERRAVQAIALANRAAAAFFAVSFVLTQFLAPLMTMIFVDASDRALIDMTTRAMRIGYMAMPAAGVVIVASSALQAVGRAGAGLALNMSRNVLTILALLFMPRMFGLDGVWATFAVTDAGGALLGGLMLARLNRELTAGHAVVAESRCAAVRQ